MINNNIHVHVTSIDVLVEANIVTIIEFKSLHGIANLNLWTLKPSKKWLMPWFFPNDLLFIFMSLFVLSAHMARANTINFQNDSTWMNIKTWFIFSCKCTLGQMHIDFINKGQLLCFFHSKIIIACSKFYFSWCTRMMFFQMCKKLQCIFIKK